MKVRRAIRLALWGLVVLSGGLLASLTLGWWQVDGPGAPRVAAGVNPVPGIGGPFAVTDHRGRVFTQREIAGRPSLMFFGFTACPDICPTTLANIGQWLRKLGPDADRLNAVFVSVDPERDSVGQIASYLQSFDPRIVGLTGTPAQLAAMAQAYRFSYARQSQGGGDYTVDHTSMVYLLDAQGKFFSAVDYHENGTAALQKIRRLLAVEGTP